jgi:heme A synthase
MDMFLYFVRRLFFDLKPWLEWALRNWGVTIVVLVALIYLARRRRRLSRYHYY